MRFFLTYLAAFTVLAVASVVCCVFLAVMAAGAAPADGAPPLPGPEVSGIVDHSRDARFLWGFLAVTAGLSVLLSLFGVSLCLRQLRRRFPGGPGAGQLCPALRALLVLAALAALLERLFSLRDLFCNLAPTRIPENAK